MSLKNVIILFGLLLLLSVFALFLQIATLQNDNAILRELFESQLAGSPCPDNCPATTIAVEEVQ